MAQPQRRRRFFVGCEGESEQGYAALLQRFANEAGLAVHIEARPIGGGDPLSIVQRSAAMLKQLERRTQRPFVGKYVILDTDKFGQSPGRDAAIQPTATAAGLLVIKQRICIESVLLRHFNGHENDNPSTPIDAMNRLLAVWSGYRKGLPAVDLAKKLTVADVKRAATLPLNNDFQHLVTSLNL